LFLYISNQHVLAAVFHFLYPMPGYSVLVGIGFALEGLAWAQCFYQSLNQREEEMKTYLKLKFWMIAAIGLSVVACGGGGSDGTTAPTLGISSVQKMGATAIPNPAAAAKPSFASNVLGKGVNWIFDKGVANAAAVPCSAAAASFFDISGGRVWISEAYAILDEVELKNEAAIDDAEFGPFALDLTDTDDNVGEAIQIDAPAGNYTGVRFRVKRVEDEATPILNVTDPAVFRSKVLDNGVKRRPSIWVKGAIGVGSEATSFTCKDFTFVTDHRWEVTIPFKSASTGTTPVDAVILFDLEGAFKAMLTASNANARNLSDEVGQVLNQGSEYMGTQYLDGRTKDPDHGTPLAEALTAQVPGNMEVFVQGAGTIDANPNGTTVIDDSATRVTGDDNPSVSDLAETVG